MSDSLPPHGLQSASLLFPWDSPARILEWVAIPFSRASFQPRDQTRFPNILADSFLLSHQVSPRNYFKCISHSLHHLVVITTLIYITFILILVTIKQVRMIDLSTIIQNLKWKGKFSSVQFSHSVVSDSLRPHESQHTRPPCPSPTPRVHSDSRPSSQ